MAQSTAPPFRLISPVRLAHADARGGRSSSAEHGRGLCPRANPAYKLRGMRPAVILLLYFAAALGLGAVLAPPLSWAGERVGLRGVDFHRYFNRAALVAAVLLLPVAARALEVRGWGDFGLRRNPCGPAQAWTGFGIALTGLWVLGAVGLAAGAFTWRPPGAGKLLGAVALAGLSAVGAAGVEELFFRGALQGLVARRARTVWGPVVFVAAFFAVLHFLKPPAGAVAPGEVNWGSGFRMIPLAFWQFGRPGLVLAGWTTLFAVGLILGWARWRTGSLWAGFGLHAGWVFGLKTFSAVARRTGATWPWFGENLLLGAGPVLTLALTGAVVWWWLRREPASASAVTLPPGTPRER